MGPFLKFEKNPEVNKQDICLRGIVYECLSDETRYDIWHGHGTIETNHRDCGEDYWEACDVQDSIKKFQDNCKRQIAILTEIYETEPTYHYGLITGPG